MSLDEREQFALELARLAGQAAKLRHLLASDPDASARVDAPQPAVDPVELAWRCQRARRQRALELGAELDEMPAKPVLDPG